MELVGGAGQADGPDVLVEGDGLLQLHQGEVVGVGLGVEARVGDDPLQVPPHRPLAVMALDVETQHGLPEVHPGEPEGRTTTWSSLCRTSYTGQHVIILDYM